MAPRDIGCEPPDRSTGRTGPRQKWMAVLAKASSAELESAWAGLSYRPEYERLRGPDTGLVMVRGRIGGTGDMFNLGEMTMTRCAVRLSRATDSNAVVGFGFVAGRDHRHAELAALFDALLQIETGHSRIQDDVIAPLAASQIARKTDATQKSRATRVDFFTMVRD